MSLVALAATLLVSFCQPSTSPAEAALIAKAREAVAREHISVEGRIVSVLDRDRLWIVLFQKPAAGPLDAGVAVLIDKKTGRVEGIADDA